MHLVNSDSFPSTLVAVSILRSEMNGASKFTTNKNIKKVKKVQSKQMCAFYRLFQLFFAREQVNFMQT